MNYSEVLENARTCIGKYCKACPVCNGVACKNVIPGPGAKGDNAVRNYEKWQEIRLNMDTINPKKDIDTSLEIFGQKFKYPFFAAPIGAINMHYSDKYNDTSYNRLMVNTCADAGIAAFTGDGQDGDVVKIGTQIIKEKGGMGVPVIKPWSMEVIKEKMAMAKESGCFAVAMDIDAAGLPFLRNSNAGSKTVEEMKEIIGMVDVPFIVKGIMTVKGALKAKEAGAAAIVVSNHGGRVLEQCPAPAEVLEEIVEAVGGSVKIFVDGGIRSGGDIFKALALGADGVLICRPFVPAAFGGDEEGVKTYIQKLGNELEDAMTMCGAASLSEITRDMVRK